MHDRGRDFAGTERRTLLYEEKLSNITEKNVPSKDHIKPSKVVINNDEAKRKEEKRKANKELARKKKAKKPRPPKRFRWIEIASRATKDRPILGAEVGVWMGKTSGHLLEDLPNLTLILVDRWKPPEPGDSFYGSGSKIADRSKHEHTLAYETTKAIVKPYEDRVVWLIGNSQEVFHSVPYGILDFVFIDGDHSYTGVICDLINWVPRVKIGGWIGGHDWNRPDKGDVNAAVLDYFDLGFRNGSIKSNTNPMDSIELGGNSTWFIKKTWNDLEVETIVDD